VNSPDKDGHETNKSRLESMGISQCPRNFGLEYAYLVMKKKELKFKVIWGSSTDFRQNFPHLAISCGGDLPTG
jgi:hypothetical protein